MKPRILYVIGQLSPGGAEQQLYYLLKYLKPNAQVVSLSLDGYWADPIRDLGINVIELPRNGRFDVKRLWALTKITRTYRPDIIHIFLDNTPGLYGRLAALLTGHFRVVTGERAEAALQQPLWYRMLKRVMNRLVAAVVSNSKSNYDYLLTRSIAPPAKLSCIPNGLELERFKINETTRPRSLQSGNGHGRLKVGTVGSLVPAKAPEVFVRAAARVLATHPGVSFIHIGDGPLRASLEALTRDLGIQGSCRFEGHRDDVPQQLHQMDLFVMSSNTEGLPNALMEAMADGLPCVVTDAGGCREVVHDGETGFVVPIGDDQKLADRIMTLLADPRLRYQMGQKGRQSMYQYNCDQMAKRYGRLYQKILRMGVN